MKLVQSVWVALIIIMNPSGVMAQTQEKVFASYPLSDADETFRFIQEVKPNEGLLPGNYKVKARLSLKSEKKDVAFESLNFELPESNRSSKDLSKQGWTALDKTYNWNPDSKENIVTIPLSHQPTAKDTAITDFDALHIDYHDHNLENPTHLSVQMLVSGQKMNRTITTLAGSIAERQLTSLKTLDISPETWKMKNFNYLAKRSLDLPFNATWKYSKSGSDMVFQRRFHLDMDAFETIDLVMQDGTTVKQIKSLVFNLRIGFKGFLEPTKFLVWGHIPKKIINIKGKKVLRFEPVEMARRSFGNNKKMYLEEIIFFYPGNQSEVIKNQPLEKIKFQTLSAIDSIKNYTGMNKKVDHIVKLPSRVETLSQKKKRLTIDIRKLHDETGFNPTVHNLILIAQPQSPDSKAGFYLYSATAVRLEKKEQPAFTDQVNNPGNY